MSVFKIDAPSLALLGDGNWLSVTFLFDLAGRHAAQFMADYSIPVPQSRLSRYIRYLHDHYIGPYLQSFDGDVAAVPLRHIFQGEDCSRHFKSVSWESQRGWDDVCLIPDPYYFMERGYEDFLPDGAILPPWSTRESSIVWRGSTTGVIEGADAYTVGFGANTLEQLPRYRMCRTLQQLGDYADVGFVSVVQCVDADRDSVAARLAAECLAIGYTQPTAMTRHKYLVDIDGNTNSWNFLQRLRLGCCILKVESPWIQWFSNRIEPWVHYVPVAADLGDLLEKMEWCRTHDRETQRIAENGRRFALGVRFETEMQQATLDILRTSTPLSGDPRDMAAVQDVCAAAFRLHPAWAAAIAARFAFPEPIWLRTAHGTILGNDDRGGLIQLAPDGDMSRAVTLSDHDGRWREQLAGFHLDRSGDTLSLERAGLFLCALQDHASTAVDRLEQGSWETFTLLPARGSARDGVR